MTPKFRVPRRKYLILLLIPLSLVVIHSLWWTVAIHQLDRGAVAWLEAQRLQGWRITTGDWQHAGWPGSAALVIPSPAVMAGPNSWSADRIILRLALAHPLTLAITQTGQQRWALDRAPAMSFDGTVILSIYFLPLEQKLPTILSLSARAAGIELPPFHPAPFGRTIAHAELDAEVLGVLPQARSPASQAAGWRDAGGRLEMRSIHLAWGQLAASADASLTLDARLQPQGDIRVRLKDPATLFAALTQAGLLAPGQARSVQAGLAFFEHPDPDTVELPLTLSDRVLRLGPVPLATLPPLLWPDRP